MTCEVYRFKDQRSFCILGSISLTNIFPTLIPSYTVLTLLVSRLPLVRNTRSIVNISFLFDFKSSHNFTNRKFSKYYKFLSNGSILIRFYKELPIELIIQDEK